MRPLIRPTLFAIARLGLFLAVVVWIVSQWWSVSISYGDTAYVSRDGLTFIYDQDSVYPSSVTVNIEYVGNLEPWFSNVVHVEQPTVMVGFLSFRHWFIVTAFALFYAVLKWVYRERRDVAKCSS